MPYYDNKSDTELIFLENYLKHLSKYLDVRKINQQTIKMNYFLNTARTQSNDNYSSLDISNFDSESIINKTLLTESEYKTIKNIVDAYNTNEDINITISDNLKFNLIDENEDFSIINFTDYNSNESHISEDNKFELLYQTKIKNDKPLNSGFRNQQAFKEQLYSTLDEFHRNFRVFVERKRSNAES